MAGPGDVLLEQTLRLHSSMSWWHLITKVSLHNHKEPLDRKTLGPLQPNSLASENSPQYYLLEFAGLIRKWVVKARVWDNKEQKEKKGKKPFEELILLKSKKSYQVFKEWR